MLAAGAWARWPRAKGGRARVRPACLRRFSSDTLWVASEGGRVCRGPCADFGSMWWWMGVVGLVLAWTVFQSLLYLRNELIRQAGCALSHMRGRRRVVDGGIVSRWGSPWMRWGSPWMRW